MRWTVAHLRAAWSRVRVRFRYTGEAQRLKWNQLRLYFSPLACVLLQTLRQTRLSYSECCPYATRFRQVLAHLQKSPRRC